MANAASFRGFSMRATMRDIRKRHKEFWSRPLDILSTITAVAFLVASLIINFLASVYATQSASNPVTDLILSNIPAYNFDDTFIYGPLVIFSIVLVLCISHPQRIPFVCKASALFIIVRSLFISLTHIAPYPTQILIEPGFITWFSVGGDLFFSGHTGFPFLFSLMFWNDKLLRVGFALASVGFGAVVLLGHLHYSIDVLSAFFITYTVFHMSEYLFVRERALFLYGPGAVGHVQRTIAR